MKISALWPLALFFAFSSLAFGCMESWAIATCEVILFLGAAVVGWKAPGFWSFPRRLCLPASLVAVLVFVGAVQVIPLPATFWRGDTSHRYTRYTKGAEAERLLHSEAYRRDPFCAEGDEPLPPEKWTPQTPPLPEWIPGSFTPASTGRALLALLAGLGLILLLEHTAREGKARVMRLAWLLGGLGLVVAILASLQHQEAQRDTILWVRHSAYTATALGPFVNPNHGAAFLNVCLPLLACLIWLKGEGEKRSRNNRWGIRSLAIALVILHVGVVALSHSVGGLMAIGSYPVALLAGGPLLCSRRQRVAVGTFLALFLLGLATLGVRSGLLTDHSRLRLATNVPAEDFLLGHGLGSFEERWPAESGDFPTIWPQRNTHLENDYLQLFFEAGAIPFLAALVLAGWVIATAVRLLLAGSAAFLLVPALIGETCHIAVDFTAHVFPIVGAMLCLYLVALCLIEREYGPLETRVENQSALPRIRPRQFAPSVLSVASFLLAMVAFFGTLQARVITSRDTLFEQGALADLVDAEQLASLGRGGEALERFRACYMRAAREGRADIATRIANGMGAAGKRLWRDPEGDGWSLISTGLLLAPNFSHRAARAEAWLFDAGWPGGTFEYPLIDGETGRSTWGTSPRRVSVWLYRDFPMLLRVVPPPYQYGDNMYRTLPSAQEVLWVYETRFTLEPFGGDTLLRVEQTNGTIPSINSPTLPFLSDAGGLQGRDTRNYLLASRFSGPVDRIGFAGRTAPPSGNVYLIRHYETLHTPDG